MRDGPQGGHRREESPLAPGGPPRDGQPREAVEAHVAADPPGGADLQEGHRGEDAAGEPAGWHPPAAGHASVDGDGGAKKRGVRAERGGGGEC